jgi:hypothetical protein
MRVLHWKVSGSSSKSELNTKLSNEIPFKPKCPNWQLYLFFLFLTFLFLLPYLSAIMLEDSSVLVMSCGLCKHNKGKRKEKAVTA